jgi:HAMP domain-containing protein
VLKEILLQQKSHNKKMPQCKALTRTGTQCANSTEANSEFCNVHRNNTTTSREQQKRKLISPLASNDEETVPAKRMKPTGNQSQDQSQDELNQLEQTVNTTVNSMQQTMQQLKQKEQQVTIELNKLVEKQQQLDDEKNKTIELNKILEKKRSELDFRNEKTDELNNELTITYQELKEKKFMLNRLIAENSLHKDSNWYNYVPKQRKLLKFHEGFYYGTFIAYNARNNCVYISHSLNCTIQKYDKGNTLVKSIGKREVKEPGYGRFRKQQGIAITSSGLLLVNDSGSSRFVIFDGDLNFIRLPIYSESSGLD